MNDYLTEPPAEVWLLLSLMFGVLMKALVISALALPPATFIMASVRLSHGKRPSFRASTVTSVFGLVVCLAVLVSFMLDYGSPTGWKVVFFAIGSGSALVFLIASARTASQERPEQKEIQSAAGKR